MSALYLFSILFSTAGMGVLDARFSLAFFHDWRRTLLALGVGFSVFVIWDVFGIALGIFFDGNSPYTTGIMLAPNFPLEEVFFLIFLCYFTLIVYRSIEKLWPRI